jgi:hypothetical protein
MQDFDPVLALDTIGEHVTRNLAGPGEEQVETPRRERPQSKPVIAKI